MMDEAVSSQPDYENLPPPLKGGETDRPPRFHLLLLFLGILCGLLVASIIIIIRIGVIMSSQDANLSEMMLKMRILENQTEQVKTDRDDLKWTQEVILKFSNFPVNDFCPDKKCQPCRTGWIQYQKKCYLFYEGFPWKTWNDSRQYCKDKAADLVVIDNLQEQEFISQNIKFYYDKDHGYWMGLQKTDKKWVWIDGHEDTFGYWRNLKDSNIYALLIPGTNTTQSWNSRNGDFRNKFICEDDKVLIRSN